MHPTVFLGLDGATFTVLDALVQDGHMPALSAIMGRGVRAPLRSTAHPLTPPAWTTVMTGRTPGAHGIYDFLRSEIRPTGAFFTLNNFRDIRCETIWTLVSRLGGRVTSLNFPLMAPPPAVNGAIIPGLLSWRHLRRNVYPKELYDELKRLSGFNAQEISWDFEHERKGTQVIPDDELESWTQFHIVREKHWFEIVRHLMTNRPADLTAVMLDGIDKLQHSCWRFLDPAFVATNPTPFERKMRALCLEFFANLDRFLADLVGLAGPDSRLWIASDHGFGPNVKVLRINKWLEQYGYLRWRTTADESSRPAAPKTGNVHYVLLDWEKTTAYAQSGATNGIDIRVSKSRGDGGVPPHEYQSFRETLIKRLLDIRDPATGTPIVTQVLPREEAFPGMHGDKAPDLTLVLCDHGFVSVLDVEPVVMDRPVVAGTHYPLGVFIACGPGVRSGARLDEQSILDVAPTLLYSLRLPVPSDFEGRVMTAAFEPSYLAANSINSGPPTLAPDQYAAWVDADVADDTDADEKILNRLRALGYVE